MIVGTFKILSIKTISDSFMLEFSNSFKKFCGNTKIDSDNPFRKRRFVYPSEKCCFEIVKKDKHWTLTWNGDTDFREVSRWISYLEEVFFDRNNLYLEGEMKISETFGEITIRREKVDFLSRKDYDFSNWSFYEEFSWSLDH